MTEKQALTKPTKTFEQTLWETADRLRTHFEDIIRSENRLAAYTQYSVN